MKPALILGLALAANAMVADSDNNELFVAPTGKLAEFAKRHPGIMFDEQADDELYRGNLPREAFKSDEEYKRYIVKISAEEADDEFLVRPLSADDEELFVAPQGNVKKFSETFRVPRRSDFKTESEWQKFLERVNVPMVTRVVAYDEVADDELAVALAPRSVFKSDEEYKKYVYSMRHSWDDAADDELAVRLLSRDHFKTEEEYQKYYNRARFTLDDAADDELAVKFVHLPTAEPVAFDDDELWGGIGFDGKGTPSFGRKFDPKQWTNLPGQVGIPFEHLKFSPEQRKKFLEQWKDTPGRYPKFADDELAAVSLPRSRFNSDEEYERYRKSMRNSRDDAADDELIFNPPQFLSQNPTDVYGRILRDSRGLPVMPLPARFDEVADDELGLKIVQFPVEHFAYDDDEFGVVSVRKPRSQFSSDEEYQKYLDRKRMYRNFDDAADDEFAINQQIVQLPAEHAAFADDEAYVPVVLAKYDEVADDELAYLGHLLNERAQPRSFDEFKKAKKPSHGEAKEKTQTKRKLRPIVDEAPLAQN